MHPLYDLTGRPVTPQHQGFLGSDGEFYTREQAKRIFERACQPYMGNEPISPVELFSEDCW